MLMKEQVLNSSVFLTMTRYSHSFCDNFFLMILFGSSEVTSTNGMASQTLVAQPGGTNWRIFSSNFLGIL